MAKHQFLVRSLLTAAVSCAAALVQPAHAGLLGGAGGAGGGSLGGSFGPHGLDAGGQAAGQLSRSGSGLSRGAQSSVDKVREPAAATRSATAGTQASGSTSNANAATAANGATQPSPSTSSSPPASPSGHSLGADASAQGSVSR